MSLKDLKDHNRNIQSNFNYELLTDIPMLTQVNTDEGRYYTDNDNNKYASVTTILGGVDKTGLDKWRKMVGDKHADNVTGMGISRGNALHSICEDYMNGEQDCLHNRSPLSIAMFMKIKKWLDDNVNKVFGVELKLYSKELKVAGTADLFCEWLQHPVVIDFKTSKKKKPRKYIKNYYMQSAAYCQMLTELTAINIKDFIIIIANEEEESQVFYGDRDKYLPQFKQLVEKFYENHPNFGESISSST